MFEKEVKPLNIRRLVAVAKVTNLGNKWLQK
jgi:hypothetical protein|uniref:Uncharacterized protein n=1 Tax=Siphoviridae sp. ctdYc1 TaxID=2826399 RepID=A0A8S5N0D3_9CAUD|nr:MAG TPA: hypothetical protein [Siphoviridae sp. ctdYc1]